MSFRMNEPTTPPVRFLETKARVENRGNPPDSFLDELVNWARSEDPSVFAPNDVEKDIFGVIRPALGPWRLTDGEAFPAFFHRRAALCEAMRVHAGFESSWNWNEGVDMTNATSRRNIEGQETGIFQVSHDSLALDKSGMLKKWLSLGVPNAVESAITFIDWMKRDHHLALQYYARLVRINTRWAGPLLRGEILNDLRPNAVNEFMRLLA